MIVALIDSCRYEIMNFQHVQPGVYDYINIGSWHEGLLSLDEEMIGMNRSDMVRSVCSEPCSKGEIKVSENPPVTVTLKLILLCQNGANETCCVLTFLQKNHFWSPKAPSAWLVSYR